jgi:hypothetical protein
MGKPERISNERYKLKDFSEEEIKQRLINVVSKTIKTFFGFSILSST